MNLFKIMPMNSCTWNGLVLSLVLGLMAHMVPATNASRSDEPWPMLLSSEPIHSDPAIALLQQRATETLERLGQAAHADEAPL